LSYDASWTSVRNILDPSVIAEVTSLLLLLLVMAVSLVVEAAAAAEEDGTPEKDTAEWKQARINSNLSMAVVLS